jgi:SAM-dependent methyltransferase
MMTQDKKEEIKINLAQLAREGDSYRGSAWGKKKMDRVFGLLEKYIDFEDGQYSVLDLGCGGMTLGRELHKIPSFNVVGVDIVYQLLCTLSKKRTPGIPLVSGDIESLPFHNDSFDLIAHNQVLHHFLARHIALSEITRVLKPGGLLFSIETNGWNPYVYYWHHSPKSKKKNFIGDNENPFGVVRFTKEVAKAGLKVREWKMINFDFVKLLAPFDRFFGAIPLFNLVFGGSMVVCAQKI